MDFLKKLTEFVSKYRYVALVLVIGLILMLLPTSSSEKNDPADPIAETAAEKTVAEELEEILRRIEGVGDVKVMLTVQTGEVVIYQYDEKSSGRDTVIITDDSRAESAVVQQVNPPIYRGAIIVCRGADSAAVRLNVIQAVSSVTGLSADRITVLKMK